MGCRGQPSVVQIPPLRGYTPRSCFDSLFHLTEHATSVRTEVLAGVTTFLALAYIIFVQPAVFSACGMDFGAVMVATCVSSAIATLLMA